MGRRGSVQRALISVVYHLVTGGESLLICSIDSEAFCILLSSQKDRGLSTIVLYGESVLFTCMYGGGCIIDCRRCPPPPECWDDSTSCQGGKDIRLKDGMVN